MSKNPIIRDAFWHGPPDPVYAWAAIARDGNLMPRSIREHPEDVIRACGECVPLRVLITYVPEDQVVPGDNAPKPHWMLVYRRERMPLYWVAIDGSRRAVDDPPPREDWSDEMGTDDPYPK